jgi:ABC-2 type transport system permease protein
MLEYRAEIFLWMLAGSLPIILMGVWIQAGNSGDFSLDAVEFARYFLCVFLVRQFTTIWVIWEFEREVVEGKLSFKLLQPLDPVWHHVARHVAEKITRIPLLLVLVFLFYLLYPQAWWTPSLMQVSLFSLFVVMAFILRFLVQYTFSMFTFWIERATAIQNFWFLLYIFLSGMIAPLEVFPPLMQTIVLWTPFPYLVYVPAAIIVGLPVNLWQSLAVMILWSVVFFFLNRWLWRKGLKQYSGMGA